MVLSAFRFSFTISRLLPSCFVSFIIVASSFNHEIHENHEQEEKIKRIFRVFCAFRGSLSASVFFRGFNLLYRLIKIAQFVFVFGKTPDMKLFILTFG